MKKRYTKATAFILFIALLITLMMPSFTAFARDWWIMPVTYTVHSRMPDSITGSNSRIYLPNITAVLSDGIEMDVNYEISKDGEVVASGAYEIGAYYDIIEAGTYTITYKGVDAENAYTFEVIADDTYPSIVLDADIPLQADTNQALAIPEARIIYQGVEQEALINVLMANGNRYIPANKIAPESGKMSLVYSAEINEKKYEFTYDLDVLNREIGFYDEAGNFYPAETKAYGHLELSGCVLNGTSTVTYTYSEIIDLSAATKDDPLIVINNAAYTGTKIMPKIKIVDIHDSNNFIQIEARWNADTDTAVYSIAKAPNQQLAAILKGAYYTQNVFGTPTTFPTSTTASKNNPATYYYDAEEKALYVKWYGQKNILIDFDAEYQKNPWEGFTTGEVYIVVERKSTTDFMCVQNVAGYSLEALQRDSVAPQISVETQSTDNMPNAVVNSQYPVPNAIAADLRDSAVPVSVRVYKGYDAVEGIEIPVVDGKFTPFEKGHYTIVYRAQDRYDNEADCRIDVLALAEDEVPAIEARIEGIPSHAYVGDKFKVPVAYDITGGCGTVSYEVYLETPSGKREMITDADVVFPEEGQNTIEYVFTDYVGRTKNYAFTVECSISPNPILYSLVMPESVRSGKTFEIPQAEYAEDASVTVSVSASLGGKPLEIVNNTVTPVIQGQQEEMTLTYLAKSATGSSEKTYTIIVYDANIADRTSFFITAQGNVLTEQTEDAIRVSTTESLSGVKFINSVLASKLKLMFKVDPLKNDSDMLTIILTDSLDPNVSLQLDIVKKPDADQSGKSELYINGVKSNDMTGNFYGGSDALQLTFGAQTNSFIDAVGNTVGTIIRTKNGEVFSGFPSGEVNIMMGAGNVGSDGFSFDILQINNQSFYNDELFFDTYAEYEINGGLSLQVELGQQIWIPAAKAGDVLSPNAEVTVSVKRGQEVVLEKQLATEAIPYVIESYGTYQITYQYSDGNNSRSANYTVRTIEHTPPQVSVPKNIPKSANVGDRVTVSKPEISDDYTQEVRVSVIVRTPTSTMLRLTEDNMSFKADKTGTYTVMFYVYDECFNYQIVTHEIVVSEQTEQKK